MLIYLAAAGVIIILVIILLTCKKLKSKLKNFDIYNAFHNHIINEKMRLRKTSFGGLFTIIFIVVAFMLISLSVLTFFLDNVKEEKALVPLAIIQKDYEEVTADIAIVTSFISYGGTCVIGDQCHPKISVSSSNIIGKVAPKVCVNKNNDCIIYYKCT